MQEETEKERTNTYKQASVLGVPQYIAIRWLIPGFIAAAYIAIYIFITPNAIDNIDVLKSINNDSITVAILLIGATLGFGFIVSIITYPQLITIREMQKIIMYKVHTNNRCIFQSTNKSYKFAIIINAIIPVVSSFIIYYLLHYSMKIVKINRVLGMVHHYEGRSRTAAMDFHLAYGSLNIGYSLLIVTTIINVCFNSSDKCIYLYIPAGLIYLFSYYYSNKLMSYGYDKVFTTWDKIKSCFNHPNYLNLYDDVTL
jgi:hypothetical protein